jgi:hypothetical protein
MPSKHYEQGVVKSKSFLYAKFQRSSEIPYIILFLIRKHVVKDEKGAIVLVIASVIIMLVLSIYLFTKGYGDPVFIDRLSV